MAVLSGLRCLHDLHPAAGEVGTAALFDSEAKRRVECPAHSKRLLRVLSIDADMRQLKAAFPKADAIYEDAIIDICGMEGLLSLRESRLIELCGVLEGRRLYAI